MEGIKEYLKQLMAYVGLMTPSQVMMLLGVVTGTIVGGIFLVGWVNSVSYSRLYSGLSESEAGEVTTYLGDNKIPFQLSDGGKTIEVPANQVYKTRIGLAAEGLPQSANIGYSIFDQNNLGMTDFLQKLNFRRALEGELTKTIVQLSEIDAARVHIVMPAERLFKDDRKAATASVVLKLRGSGSLTRRQTNGITHLLASSVEGLEPGNVTIIDYNGNLLSSSNQHDEVASLSSSQLDVRKQVESYLQDKAQSMLDQVLGSSRAVVRVTADLNFQQLERTSEIFDANAPAIRSEERIKVTSIVTDKSQETNESSVDDNSETTITNYELNKTVEHIINAMGTIERLSIAVMVDGIYNPVENDAGEIEMIYQPRSQEEMDRLATIVQNSVGFDQQRNDQIEMVNIAFDRQNMQVDRELLDAMYTREFYIEIAKKVGLVLLVAFLFLYFKKKASKLFAALAQIAPPSLPQRVAQRADAPVAIDEEPETVQPIRAQKRKPKLVDQMQETAKEQPEEIAKVIKTIMAE